MEDLDILTLTEAAELLGRAPSTLRAQVVAGRLRGRKIGKTWVTSRAEVERYRRESLGQPGRPSYADVLERAANLLEPKTAPFEDVLGRPGEPNVLEQPTGGHRPWSQVKRERQERDAKG